MNKDEFLQKSIDVHGDTYSYDLIPENINIGYGTPDIPNLNIGTKIDFRKPIYS